MPGIGSWHLGMRIDSESERAHSVEIRVLSQDLLISLQNICYSTGDETGSWS